MDSLSATELDQLILLSDRHLTVRRKKVQNVVHRMNQELGEITVALNAAAQEKERRRQPPSADRRVTMLQ